MVLRTDLKGHLKDGEREVTPGNDQSYLKELWWFVLYKYLYIKNGEQMINAMAYVVNAK